MSFFTKLGLVCWLSLTIFVADELHGGLWDIVYEHIPSYGNYCGPNMTYGGPNSLLCPLPTDKMDAACAAHDYLYSHTGEGDFFPRALADLKLTGSFLTAPASSLKALTYSIAGSIAMPIQAIRWTAQGTANESHEWFGSIEPNLNEYQYKKAQEQRVYQDQQTQYVAEITRINEDNIATVKAKAQGSAYNEAYSKWFEESKTRWSDFDKGSNRLWEGFYAKWKGKKPKEFNFKQHLQYLAAYSDDYKRVQNEIESMKLSMIKDLESKKP